MKELKAKSLSGYFMLLVIVAILVGAIVLIAILPGPTKLLGILTIAFDVFLAIGFFMVAPNEGKVLQLFGEYVGTEKQEGLRWANPLYMKKKVSLRVRNFESAKLKVNDQLGNPIEIAAVVVWRVVDSAEAIFEVDDYQEYVVIQSEAAIRNMATSYPYDQHEEGEVAIRSHAGEIAQILKQEIQTRLGKAGVEVIESRISHLAYAPEIANAMLQRQQATAIVAARNKIVEGAVGMVELALDKLAEKEVVELDEERKAAMVSNLLVVLCGDQNTQPVVNTGSLYS